MSRQLKGTPVANGVVNKIRQRHDNFMRIAFGLFDSQKALCTRAARFIDNNQRLFHQLVLDDDALDQTGHLVGPAARTCRHHKLHRLGGFPSCAGAISASAATATAPDAALVSP